MTSKMVLQRIGNGCLSLKSERKAGSTVFIIYRRYLQTSLENQDQGIKV